VGDRQCASCYRTAPTQLHRRLAWHRPCPTSAWRGSSSWSTSPTPCVSSSLGTSKGIWWRLGRGLRRNSCSWAGGFGLGTSGPHMTVSVPERDPDDTAAALVIIRAPVCNPGALFRRRCGGWKGAVCHTDCVAEWELQQNLGPTSSPSPQKHPDREGFHEKHD
jgi:hypothetical protein